MEFDDTLARQAAIAAEGLRRHRAIANSPAPLHGNPVEYEIGDAILNWGNGTLSPTPGADFPVEVAGIGVSQQASISTMPRDFGHKLTSAPDGRGGAQTFEEIMRGRR
jgi:hypothetical protein